MNRYCGIIGFGRTIETSPGVWVEDIEERRYFGDILRNYKRTANTENLNDNIQISNQLSIVADPYAKENFHHMLYATFMGIKWKIESVDVQFPRLILSLGGEYNV